MARQSLFQVFLTLLERKRSGRGVASMRLQAGLREGSFLECWGSSRLGHIAAFIHDIITTARLTSLSLPYHCSKKTVRVEYLSVPIFDIAFISESKLLVCKFLNQGRSSKGWSRCGEVQEMSMLTVRERVQPKWWTLTSLRKREMWLENTMTGGRMEMWVKWLVTAGEGKGKGCRCECELKGRPQISLCQRKESSVWVCKQLGNRLIGILCKSFFLLRAKAKFPRFYEQMVLGLQKIKKICGEILLLLISLITSDCRVKQILTWRPSTHYLATALLKLLRMYCPSPKPEQKKNKRTTPTSLTCLKCYEARHRNRFGVLLLVSALDITFKRQRKRISYT